VPAYPADTFAARVDAVGAGLEADTRTLSVRALIASADDRLKPQMLANVLVQGAGSVAAVFVPEDAVQLIQGKPNVFVARPDGRAAPRSSGAK
jgi:multidrug efflux pump subunit AcrA (membrane-fusion protein)